MSGMNFRISDTFTASLARLTGDEQKAVKTTAFDLQLNPANPGMSFHKLDKARDKNFWSVRVGSDIRLIVHRSADSLLLCYVDHHDRAYQWAERRRLEAHPTTGAAQWVEVRERVDEILVHKAVPTREPAVPPGGKPLLFSHMSDEDLLGWGVPTEWLAEVRLADEDSLLTLADRLPAEAAEALIELATGGTPRRPQTATAGADPFAHPDAQRRFRVMQDVEELERALEFPWDQWTVFLHPAQRQWVERDHGGPARVSGSAGTGKTIVALHRAVHLARNNENARVLLTTFSPALAHALHARLRRLVGRTPMLAERIDVVALDELGERLFKFAFGKPALVDDQTVRRYLGEAAASVSTPAKAGGGAGLPAKFGAGFWWSEWADVIDPWQIDNEEGYRDFRRLGRKTRLSEGQRTAAWQVFGRVRERLRAENRLTRATLFARLAEHYAGAAKLPFEHVVVDEAQDISAPQLRFLSALGGQQRNALFFAGDLGQRIFQLPFSWKSLGVDVRGRSRTLHVNYRTSHQIRMQADRLLGPELADVDGNNEDRKGTVSVFNGPAPVVRAAASIEAEAEAVAEWLTECAQQGLRAGEMAVFVRSDAELDRARRAVSNAGLAHHVLDEHVETDSDEVSIGTMHLAKGLEFRCVAVMACDDEVVPLQERIDSVADEADLKEVYDTERHLLYVACTRARDRLLVSGVEPASEFLSDLSRSQDAMPCGVAKVLRTPNR
jgi:mRNA-degrading endonuclease RelE of RelBE toxin-antitoxin system